MKKLQLTTLLLAALLLASPAQAQKLKDAFLDIDKKTLKKEYTHLAMLPLISTPSLALPDSMKQLILDEVNAKLTKSKFELLPATEVLSIQKEFADLYSADAKKESQAAIDEHAVRELFFRHEVDGLVSIQVTAVAAPFQKDRAEWHGTSQKIQHSGDGFMKMLSGKSYGGNIAASSIRIVISDRKGKPIYNWSGGIELMMQREGENLKQLPTENLWQDEKRVRKAAQYAVKPI